MNANSLLGDGGHEQARGTCATHAWVSLHRADFVAGRAVHFAGGVAIGGFIVLLVWLMVG